VQLFGELLFGSDSRDLDRRDAGEIQKVPKCDLLYRARIVIDKVNVEAKDLEHLAGHPRRNRNRSPPSGPSAWIGLPRLIVNSKSERIAAGLA
jgi:hypothetical protein